MTEAERLQRWAERYWRDAGLACTFVRRPFWSADRDSVVLRLHDPETDIVWRLDVARDVFLERDVQGALLELFEEQEMRIRQATFYVHHCREVLRAVQQDRHDAYMRELLASKPEAQA